MLELEGFPRRWLIGPRQFSTHADASRSGATRQAAVTATAAETPQPALAARAFRGCYRKTAAKSRASASCKSAWCASSQAWRVRHPVLQLLSQLPQGCAESEVIEFYCCDVNDVTSSSSDRRFVPCRRSTRSYALHVSCHPAWIRIDSESARSVVMSRWTIPAAVRASTFDDGWSSRRAIPMHKADLYPGVSRRIEWP